MEARSSSSSPDPLADDTTHLVSSPRKSRAVDAQSISDSNSSLTAKHPSAHSEIKVNRVRRRKTPAKPKPTQRRKTQSMATKTVLDELDVPLTPGRPVGYRVRASSPLKNVVSIEDSFSSARTESTHSPARNDENASSPSDARRRSTRAPRGKVTLIPLNDGEETSAHTPKRRRKEGGVTRRAPTPAAKVTVDENDTDDDNDNDDVDDIGENSVRLLTPKEQKQKERTRLGTPVPRTFFDSPRLDGEEDGVEGDDTPAKSPQSLNLSDPFFDIAGNDDSADDVPEAPSIREIDEDEESLDDPFGLPDEIDQADIHQTPAAPPIRTLEHEQPSSPSYTPAARHNSRTNAGHTPAPKSRTYPSPTTSSLEDLEEEEAASQKPSHAPLPAEARHTKSVPLRRVNDPTSVHREFDSIMESEGFSMVSLDTLPSAKQHLNESGFPARQHRSSTRFAPTHLRRMLLQSPRPNSSIGYKVPPQQEEGGGDASFQGTPNQSAPNSLLSRPPLRLQIDRGDGRRLFTSETNQSPVQDDFNLPPGGSAEVAPKSETPTRTALQRIIRVIKIGVALQHALIYSKNFRDTRQHLDLLFQAYDGEIRWALRTGLKFGVAMARKRREERERRLQKEAEEKVRQEEEERLVQQAIKAREEQRKEKERQREAEEERVRKQEEEEERARQEKEERMEEERQREAIKAKQEEEERAQQERDRIDMEAERIQEAQRKLREEEEEMKRLEEKEMQMEELNRIREKHDEETRKVEEMERWRQQEAEQRRKDEEAAEERQRQKERVERQLREEETRQQEEARRREEEERERQGTERRRQRDKESEEQRHQQSLRQLEQHRQLEKLQALKKREEERKEQQRQYEIQLRKTRGERRKSTKTHTQQSPVPKGADDWAATGDIQYPDISKMQADLSPLPAQRAEDTSQPQAQLHTGSAGDVKYPTMDISDLDVDQTIVPKAMTRHSGSPRAHSKFLNSGLFSSSPAREKDAQSPAVGETTTILEKHMRSEMAKREEEWRRERKAVSRQIADADKSQVIVFDSEDEEEAEVTEERGSQHEHPVHQDAPVQRYETRADGDENNGELNGKVRSQVEQPEEEDADDDMDIWQQAAHEGSKSRRNASHPEAEARSPSDAGLPTVHNWRRRVTRPRGFEYMSPTRRKTAIDRLREDNVSKLLGTPPSAVRKYYRDNGASPMKHIVVSEEPQAADPREDDSIGGAEDENEVEQDDIVDAASLVYAKTNEFDAEQRAEDAVGYNNPKEVSPASGVAVGGQILATPAWLKPRRPLFTQTPAPVRGRFVPSGRDEVSDAGDVVSSEAEEINISKKKERMLAAPPETKANGTDKSTSHQDQEDIVEHGDDIIPEPALSEPDRGDFDDHRRRSFPTSDEAGDDIVDHQPTPFIRPNRRIPRKHFTPDPSPQKPQRKRAAPVRQRKKMKSKPKRPKLHKQDVVENEIDTAEKPMSWFQRLSSLAQSWLRGFNKDKEASGKYHTKRAQVVGANELQTDVGKASQVSAIEKVEKPVPLAEPASSPSVNKEPLHQHRKPTRKPKRQRQSTRHSQEGRHKSSHRRKALSTLGYFSDDHYYALRALYRSAKSDPANFLYVPSPSKDALLGQMITSADGSRSRRITKLQIAVVDRFKEHLSEQSTKRGGSGIVGWSDVELLSYLFTIIVGAEIRMERRKLHMQKRQQSAAS